MSSSLPHRFQIKTLLWLIAIPLVLGGAVAAVVWAKGDAWKAQALEAVNDQLNGELNVTAVSLSWWNGFPDISVDLRNVTVISETSDTVLVASRMGLELDFWSIWGDQTEVASIAIDNGDATLIQDQRGVWNVESLKVDAPESADQMAVALKKLVLRNMDIHVSVANDPSAKFRLDKGTCSMALGERPMNWQASVSNVILHGASIPEKLQPFDAFCQGDWHSPEPSVWRTSGDIEVAGMSATWQAQQDGPEAWKVEVQSSSITQRNVERVWSDAPWKGMLDIDHRITLNATIQEDDVNLDWSTTKDAFQLAPSWTGLSMAVQATGEARGTVRRKDSQWSWVVDYADLSGPGWRAKGNAHPTGPNSIFLSGEASLDAATPIDAWIPGIPHNIQSMLPVSGEFSAKGDFALTTDGQISPVQGSLTLSQLAGKLDGQPYLIDVDAIDLNPNHAEADSLIFEWAGIQSEIDFFELAWPALTSGAAFTGRVNIRASSLAIDPILQWWSHLNNTPSEQAVLLPRGSDLDLHVDASTVDWEPLHSRNLSARTNITHNRWHLHSIQVDGLEGHAHVEGQLAPGRAGWVLALRGSLDDVSAPELFSTFNNFGQSLLRHDHLGGAISTAGNLSMSWGLDGSWHPEHLTASLQTQITHGRLRNLEVFEDVADYLDDHRLMAPLVDPEDLRERLRDVTFEPVEQRVDVRGEQVWLPQTIIASSAMNVAIEGTYDFDSNIDYTLGFALRDLRASAEDNVGVMEDDGLGTQVFLRMFGSVAAPEYAYDRDAAKAHRRAAFAAEKERLRDALKQRRDGDNSIEQDSAPTTNPGSETKGASTDTIRTESVQPDQKSLLNRIRKPKKDKTKERENDLLNPDDEDYL